ncbi:MAG: hypothetical protein OHK0052_04780 [Anaerolineales bacterium]
MRLYHRLNHSLTVAVALLVLLLAACAPAPSAPVTGQLNVQITADGQTIAAAVDAGSTVEEALQQAGLTIGDLDRSDPPLSALVKDGAQITLVRVRESFSVEQQIIPFQRQTLRNEALPEGETRLIQAGVNGLQETTYRIIYEENQEISRSAVKTETITEAQPEIFMVGAQTSFQSIALPGRLVYLAGGNAWTMEGSSGERRPVVTLGDLDGRILRLSRDGLWLLFTRKSEVEGQINSLWAARLDPQAPLLIDLKVANVIHFADWVPNSTLRVAFSTVEPRSAAPGWQANNDLNFVSFSTTGWISRPDTVVQPNAGGVYGWWGTSFVWSPDGKRLAFSRPDGVGLVNLEDGSLRKVLDVPPLQTFGDWAWTPGVAWSPDGQTLYTVQHPPQGSDSGAAETSPLFELTGVPLGGGAPVALSNQTGMFAYPAVSPAQIQYGKELAAQVAFLQALFPTQSETSRYRLMIADRDGSDVRAVFPEEGAAGLNPQQVVWSPAALPGQDEAYGIALIYQGNLWIVNARSGAAFQLTSDGLTTHMDWR